MLPFLYLPCLIYAQDYTFLLNEINSNSNRRFRFGSNINGVIFYATQLPDLPNPISPTQKSFYIVFENCDIFDLEWFETEVLKSLNSATWYFVVAYLNYRDNGIYKRLHTNHYIYPSAYFSLHGNSKICILHNWLVSKQIEPLKESYGIDNNMINDVTVYFSVSHDNVVNEWPCSNDEDFEINPNIGDWLGSAQTSFLSFFY